MDDNTMFDTIGNGKIVCSKCNSKNGVKRKFCFMCGKQLVLQNNDSVSNEQNCQELNKINMKRRTIIFVSMIAILIIALCVVGFIAISDHKANIKQYNVKTEKYNKLNSEYEKLAQENKEKDKQIEELSKSETIETIEKEINELTIEKESLIAEKETLIAEKEELENKITSLNANVIKIKGTAKSYPAGYLTAGKDFEVGRYKIYGGSSNFAVFSSSGDLRVNIILGNYNDGLYVKEYIYNFSYGDEVQADSPFKMVAVE